VKDGPPAVYDMERMPFVFDKRTNTLYTAPFGTHQQIYSAFYDDMEDITNRYDTAEGEVIWG
jgi:hypothetical protein